MSGPSPVEPLECWAGPATCMDSWVPPDTTFNVALRPYLLLAAFYSFVPLIMALRLARTGADALRRKRRVPAADMPPWLHIDVFMCAVMAVNLVLWVATAQGTIDWKALRMDVANSLSVSITFGQAVLLGWVPAGCPTHVEPTSGHGALLTLLGCCPPSPPFMPPLPLQVRLRG